MRVLIGGVGYRFQRDASFGLHVSDALAAAPRPGGVDVEDLGYGALLAAQDIAAADPCYDRVVLVASAVRDRPPGLYLRRPDPGDADPEEVQARIREAGAGVIDLDHLLVVGRWLAAFPPWLDVRLIELEPWDVSGGEGLSEEAERLLPDAIEAALAAAAPAPAASATERKA